MRHLFRKLSAALVVLALLSTPALGYTNHSRKGTLEAEKTNPMWDLFFLRPMGVGALAVSAAVWVPMQAACMIVRPTEWKKPIDMMLVEPFEFVFVDPLGSH